jgi:hypothetical protein
MTQPSLFGTPDAYGGYQPVDLSRGSASPESQAAFKRVTPTLRETHARILAWLEQRGAAGGTSKEFAAHEGVELHTISGRFSELKRDGKIRPNGVVRDKYAVVVINT